LEDESCNSTPLWATNGPLMGSLYHFCMMLFWQ